MPKQWKAQKPNYFFVLFGKKYAPTRPVEGGVYPLSNRYVSREGVTTGDVMLLYCAGDYPGHDKEAPGVGIVICTETGGAEEVIYYQYFPLDKAVPLGTIRATIPGLRPRLDWIRNCVQKISNADFRAALAGRQIDWP